jgi:hypothetical protein
MDIFKEKMTEMPSQDNVKVAQSTSEKSQNFASGMMTDFNARSVEHVERPRYGHKV